ncbi:hypothetical protein ILYODFUR_007362 [Ilyodon furcidens]|uniref:Uncharacterized protein n=1 Tax=Ilyodon furcidens TaxID=33524 RepID=A0ABV0V256_9TELE
MRFRSVERRETCSDERTFSALLEGRRGGRMNGVNGGSVRRLVAHRGCRNKGCAPTETINRRTENREQEATGL